MNEHLDVNTAKIVILCLLAGYLVFRLIYRRLLKNKRPAHPGPGLKYKILTTVFLSLLASLSAFSYFNFGRLHGDGQQVHYWEMFHYYMNAKYFRELGYLDLYSAAVAADAEMDNRIPNETRVMDLRTYQQRTRAEVLATEGTAVKSRFAPARWEQFKRDLTVIMNHDSRINDMVNDHGFNATPFWTILGGPLANAVPLDHVWILAWLDVLLMAIMFFFLFWAFGLETMLVSIVFFFANFFTSFYFLGGSMLRYDWLAAAVIGVCCLKKGNYLAGGSLLAASALLRIFPVLFAAALGVKAILETIREKRVPTRYLKFFGAFLGFAALLALLLFTLGNPVTILSTYAGRMGLHNSIMLTNNVGLKMFVLADVSNLDWGYFSKIYQPLDPGKDVFINWNAWKLKEAAGLWPVFVLIALAAFALVGLIGRRRDDAEATTLGVLLIFALVAPTMYYYAFLVILFMVLARREPTLKNTIATVLFAVTIASCFVIHLQVEFYLAKFLIISCVLLACFMVIGSLEISEMVRRKQPALPAAPPGKAPEGG
jgi:hypothetical protein